VFVEKRRAAHVSSSEGTALQAPKDRRMNNEAGPIGFSADVKPRFREKDRDSMRTAFDLWDYADVVRHAPAILRAVTSGKMPCDGRWDGGRVDLLRRWIDAGTPP
jgi:hypothetical protein